MQRSIAVGIGGAGAGQALSWATEEAERSGARLVLRHVRSPGSLIEASVGMRLLVIGAGEGDRTVRRVLRHARCPVVVVRPTAQASWSSPFDDQVVAGVDGTRAGQAVVEFAYTYAAAHHLAFTAVHVSEASRDGHRYTDPALSSYLAVEPEALDLLAAETQPWELRWPDVTTRRTVLRGSVVDTLIRAGVGARLLVVGDKRRGIIGRARTGDVPLTVTNEAPCPVAVIPVGQNKGGAP